MPSLSLFAGVYAILKGDHPHFHYIQETKIEASIHELSGTFTLWPSCGKFPVPAQKANSCGCEGKEARGKPRQEAT